MIRKRLIQKFSVVFPTRRQAWRWLLPILLVLLFLSTLLWLPWQTQRMEANERQEQLIADTLWVEQTIRFQLGRHEENLRLIASEILSGHLPETRLRERLGTLVRTNRELTRIVQFDRQGRMVLSTDDVPVSLKDLSPESRLASENARKSQDPQYAQPTSRTSTTTGPAMLDYHVPLHSGDTYLGELVASYSIPSILNEMVPWWFAQDNEISLTDQDDNVIDQRAAGGPGRNVYTHRRGLDLPGVLLTLRTNSVKGEPKLLPSLLVGSVITLSLGLLWSLWALWRDINRRLAAEHSVPQWKIR
jgi:two-component system, LuxR family, sensor histidine kinase DctS